MLYKTIFNYLNINYIFFEKVDTIFIVVNLTIFNFIILNHRKLKMTSLSSLTVAFSVSPSLNSFLGSLVAGAVVLGIIGAALAIISTSDRVTRS